MGKGLRAAGKFKENNLPAVQFNPAVSVLLTTHVFVYNRVVMTQ